MLEYKYSPLESPDLMPEHMEINIPITIKISRSEEFHFGGSYAKK